jgi:hypothetical protein
MDLDGARNAKADIFLRAFGFVEAGVGRLGRSIPHFVAGFATEEFEDFGAVDAAPGLTHFRIGIGPMSLEPLRRNPPSASGGSMPAPPIAVGIGRSGSGSGGSELLLLGARRELEHHPVVERAIELAKGEARFVNAGVQRKLSHWNPARRRPICPGLSVAHYRVTSGSVGAFVDLGEDGVGILSNNHVLADINRGAIGDPVIQPAKRDAGGRPADVVGSLHRFVELQEGAASVNRVDAAIAKLVDIGDALLDLPPGLGGPPRVAGVRAEEVLPEDAVFKVGRTTGVTSGAIFAVEVDNYIVNLGSDHRPFLCRFDDQIQAYAGDRHFALPGDSGSAVLDPEGNAIGLIFAGSLKGAPSGFGIASINPISAVLEELDTKLLIP